MSNKTSLNKALFLTALGIIVIAGGWYLMEKNKHQNPPTGLDLTPSTELSSLTPGEQTLMSAATSPVTVTPETGKTTTVTPSSPKTTPVMEPNGTFLGRADAPVQIIEFSSLTCTHCAHFHNDILDEFRVKYIDTGLVRLEFRSFPLNKPALDATLLLNCLPKDRYFPFMSMLYQTQDHWAFSNEYMTSLKQNAKLAGLSDTGIDTCLNDKGAVEKLATQIKTDAEKYKLESTPTFIINDGKTRVNGALPVSEFAKEIDPLLPQNPQK